MKKFLPIFVASFPLLFLLFGFGCIGEKATSISIVYKVLAIIALLLFIGFHFVVKNKDKWFYLLFGSVFVVNLGYYLMSVSTNLNQALSFNNLSYLGSVFLPLSMLMTIMNVVNVKLNKYLTFILLGIAILMFILTASPSFSNLYYESASIEIVNGVTVLNKVYGKLHCMYLFYLISYFIGMISVISYSIAKKKVSSSVHASILLFAVLVNIIVWLIEQLVKIDFEFLSISYIISELFLLGVYLLLQEKDNIIFGATRLLATPIYPNYAYANMNNDDKKLETSSVPQLTPEQIELCEFFTKGLLSLTPTEYSIYEYYVAGKRANEVMKLLGIQANTIKFHNKNLYRKLGVSSRKQMIEIDSLIKARSM